MYLVTVKEGNCGKERERKASERGSERGSEMGGYERLLVDACIAVV